MCGGLKYICDQIGMEHYSSVRLRPKNDPTMPTLAYLIWIANNLTSWGMEMANDREMVEKLKTALDTDMEPKWYRSGLGGCPLVCAPNSFSPLIMNTKISLDRSVQSRNSETMGTMEGVK